MDLKTVTVLWMDDREETYPDVSTIVREGILHIHQYVPPRGSMVREWHLPTSNIRVWYPDGQAPPGG